MYDGSTLLFVAKAVAENSPVGLVLAAWVYVVYALARAAEEYVGSPRPLLRARRAGGRGRRADLGWTDPRVAPRGTGSRQGGMARGAPRSPWGTGSGYPGEVPLPRCERLATPPVVSPMPALLGTLLPRMGGATNFLTCLFSRAHLLPRVPMPVPTPPPQPLHRRNLCQGRVRRCSGRHSVQEAPVGWLAGGWRACFGVGWGGVGGGVKCPLVPWRGGARVGPQGRSPPSAFAPPPLCAPVWGRCRGCRPRGAGFALAMPLGMALSLAIFVSLLLPQRAPRRRRPPFASPLTVPQPRPPP